MDTNKGPSVDKSATRKSSANGVKIVLRTMENGPLGKFAAYEREPRSIECNWIDASDSVDGANEPAGRIANEPEILVRADNFVESWY